MFELCNTYRVDKKILYVGSDDPHRNSNEEYAVWIDVKAAVEA